MAEDIFDDIISLESQFLAEGESAGVRDGKQSGLLDGHRVGLQRGIHTGAELGFYYGCATMMVELAYRDLCDDRCVSSFRTKRPLRLAIFLMH